MKYSNCLIEALRAWIKAPLSIRIRYLLAWEHNTPSIHFYWYDARIDRWMAFHAKDRNLSTLNKLWFEGSVKQYHFYKQKKS